MDEPGFSRRAVRCYEAPQAKLGTTSTAPGESGIMHGPWELTTHSSPDLARPASVAFRPGADRAD